MVRVDTVRLKTFIGIYKGNSHFGNYFLPFRYFHVLYGIFIKCLIFFLTFWRSKIYPNFQTVLASRKIVFLPMFAGKVTKALKDRIF